ncbi:hypothetical protein FRC15_006194 [Serendipita sp. 397]|nr:hypothetical protein FRC15_006194 [Serendipita sp. 397]KAG8799552.1 hypothetical protein FRC16_004846 [Serendipita sp. 398]
MASFRTWLVGTPQASLPTKAKELPNRPFRKRENTSKSGSSHEAPDIPPGEGYASNPRISHDLPIGGGTKSTQYTASLVEPPTVKSKITSLYEELGIIRQTIKDELKQLGDLHQMIIQHKKALSDHQINREFYENQIERLKKEKVETRLQYKSLPPLKESSHPKALQMLKEEHAQNQSRINEQIQRWENSLREVKLQIESLTQALSSNEDVYRVTKVSLLAHDVMMTSLRSEIDVIETEPASPWAEDTAYLMQRIESNLSKTTKREKFRGKSHTAKEERRKSAFIFSSSEA